MKRIHLIVITLFMVNISLNAAEAASTFRINAPTKEDARIHSRMTTADAASKDSNSQDMEKFIAALFGKSHNEKSKPMLQADAARNSSD